MFNKLRAVMEEQHIRPYSLAKKADISSSDLYSALRGEKPMFPNWRKRIAKVLNTEEKDLFDDEGARKNDEH